MPVYHFTLHAYRSWGPEHDWGYTRHQKHIEQDMDMAVRYAMAANDESRLFTMPQCTLLIAASREIAFRRGWRVHAMTATPTHTHTLVSWPDAAIEWRTVRDKLKSLTGLALSRDAGQTGLRWWGRKGSRKRVRDMQQFMAVVAYIKRHEAEGVVWIENESLPA